MTTLAFLTMFEGYSTEELQAIFMMQSFNGLSMFAVFLLMALGLAIIFGQMKVINMAHGEFLTLGAYTTVFVSNFVGESAEWRSRTTSRSPSCSPSWSPVPSATSSRSR